MHEHRAERLCSLRKPSLRVLRGIRKVHLPEDVGFVHFLRNLRHQHTCAQAELIVQAACDPTIARRASQGEFVMCCDHYELLHSVRN